MTERTTKKDNMGMSGELDILDANLLRQHGDFDALFDLFSDYSTATYLPADENPFLKQDVVLVYTGDGVEDPTDAGASVDYKYAHLGNWNLWSN